MTRPIIALDCDGVLLDYGYAYGQAWERAFGEVPKLVQPAAYWPKERWGVPELAGTKLEKLRGVFDEVFWSTLPALPGAIEACKMLVAAGFDLVCITALNEKNLAARRTNLANLGFPLEKVIATPHVAEGKSPKADAIHELRPVAFADDFAPYFAGVDQSIHKALIVRDRVGSPNVGDVLKLADSTHMDLVAFANWWSTRHASI